MFNTEKLWSTHFIKLRALYIQRILVTKTLKQPSNN